MYITALRDDVIRVISDVVIRLSLVVIRLFEVLSYGSLSYGCCDTGVGCLHTGACHTDVICSRTGVVKSRTGHVHVLSYGCFACSRTGVVCTRTGVKTNCMDVLTKPVRRNSRMAS